LERERQQLAKEGLLGENSEKNRELNKRKNGVDRRGTKRNYLVEV
jgi:hypothetical protein